MIPILAEEEIVKVFTVGAKKYGDSNWRGGINFSRNYAAARRHLRSFFKGEEIDSETQTSHLANAAVNIIMMLQFHLEGRAKDLNDIKSTWVKE